MNLLMLLMQGMMTKFMLTNIFGEPNDYTLESLTRLMVRMEMLGVDENDNKPEHKDASHDNEDTCDVCLCDVENVVHFTENNVEVQELFKDDRN